MILSPQIPLLYGLYVDALTSSRAASACQYWKSRPWSRRSKKYPERPCSPEFLSPAWSNWNHPSVPTEDAAILYASFIALGLVLRNAHANQSAGDAADRAADADSRRTTARAGRHIAFRLGLVPCRKNLDAFCSSSVSGFGREAATNPVADVLYFFADRVADFLTARRSK